ncbi:hypothetical protein ACFWR1_37145, partial [Streptomyces sp. NPDC058603]
MADDVSITVRVRDATTAGVAAVNRSINRLIDNTRDMDQSFGSARGAALSLAPALIPMAASVAPLAAGLGAATVAVGAFGAAIVPQAQAMKEASDAEEKYSAAVKEHGKASAEAVKAEKTYLIAVKELPPATRQAAASLSVLKDEYKDWSNSLAGDTMPVATKSFAIFGALFPKLTPLVQGASSQLSRFLTLVAGGIQARGFDSFMTKFSDFATKSMSRAIDGMVRLARTMDTGAVGGGISEFMQYARENGPLVGDVLKNIGQALTRLLVAASDVGVGMLTVVNAFAALVASLPTSLITTLLQLALVFKAIRIAAAGMAVVGTALAAVRAQAVLAGTAAVGASGGVAALTAAFMALSRGARLAVASTGIGLLVVGLVKLSSIGRDAPPNVDRLTSSLANLGRTGKASGEAARVFGKDLDGLYKSVRALTDPSTADGVQQFLVGWTGFDSTPVKEAKESVNALDDALTSMVRGGKGDLAAAALERLKAAYQKGGGGVSDFTSKLDGYKAALADAKFEQQLAADAQGLFGQQALATKEKLDAQKASADGLRQSIQALNDVNRAASG